MVRRFLCVLSVIGLTFSLCACESVKVPFELTAFTSQVSFQSAGTTIKGELTYNSPEDITFTVSEPENIRGLRFQSSENLISVGIENLTLPQNRKSDSPVNTLFLSLCEIAGSEIRIPLKGLHSCETDSSKIKLDCQSKRIISIDIDNYHYKFE